jgi:hypothetical protein
LLIAFMPSSYSNRRANAEERDFAGISRAEPSRARHARRNGERNVGAVSRGSEEGRDKKKPDERAAWSG